MKVPVLLLLLAACDQGVLGDDTSGSDDTADTGKDTDQPHDTATDTGECDPTDTSMPATEGLPDLIPLVPSGVVLTERVVTESDCAWVEKCVGGLGKRRLLRFDQRIANVGDDDLVMGDPDLRPALFEYSLCHGHHHFTDFAAYDLRDAGGNVVARGHKQAFCLLDSSRYLTDDPEVARNPRYTCQDQGIQRGWSDEYGGYLDCQWVDVTDLAPGDYTLQIAIDPLGHIPETDDTNNTSSVTVTIPEPDVTAGCGPFQAGGTDRDCGWALAAQGTCAAGERVTVGCFDQGACGDYHCTENPILRVCEGLGEDCLEGGAWASGDDACNTDCPQTSFLCPPSGEWTAWKAAWGTNAPPQCTISSSTAPMPAATDACTGTAVDGTARECGWTVQSQGACTPGEAVWVGCDPGGCGLGACPDADLPDALDAVTCDGDPMLRACPGEGPCHAREALAQSDDACGALCPAAMFTCPEEGSFTVLTAPYERGHAYTCEVGHTPFTGR